MDLIPMCYMLTWKSMEAVWQFWYNVKHLGYHKYWNLLIVTGNYSPDDNSTDCKFFPTSLGNIAIFYVKKGRGASGFTLTGYYKNGIVELKSLWVWVL